MRYLLPYCLLVFLGISCQQPTANNQQNTASYKDSAIGCAPDVTDTNWYRSGKKAPLLKGLGGLHFPISTNNKEAQSYFDQGLMLSFGFNHAEAARSFNEAAKLDTNCAMAWWGFAFVLGPNYNAGMEKDNFLRAYTAVQKALAKEAGCTAKEKLLIAAMASRYSADTSAERPVLDSNYASAMRKVYQLYPADATIASLFAESLMNLHPWNLWQKNGSIQPWTPEIITVLKNAIKTDPKHAGANHFYIHAMEMSEHAEDALASADLLLNLVPGSGHLVHMASHTYIRVGKYHEGVVSNIRAALADSLYLDACHAQGAYPLAYYPHNHHFLAACATLSGESSAALTGAIATAEHASKKLMEEPAWATLQHYYTIPWYVSVKLGQWDYITASKEPAEALKYPRVVWHYAQGMAMLHSNKISEASGHLEAIKELMKDSSIKSLSIWGINTMYDLCNIASGALEAEIAAKQKNYPAAIKLLKAAIVAEDGLNYNEPPDWFFSGRQNLGAILIEAGKYKEAIVLYQQDLKTYRENGWALKGLMNAYEKMNDQKQYDAAKLRFEKAWQHADIAINTSRIL